jgi:hypothetical protein
MNEEGGCMTKVNSDRIERGFVLGNKALVAEVFAKHGFPVLSRITEQTKTSEVKVEKSYQSLGAYDSGEIDFPLVSSLT